MLLSISLSVEYLTGSPVKFCLFAFCALNGVCFVAVAKYYNESRTLFFGFMNVFTILVIA